MVCAQQTTTRAQDGRDADGGEFGNGTIPLHSQSRRSANAHHGEFDRDCMHTKCMYCIFSYSRPDSPSADDDGMSMRLPAATIVSSLCVCAAVCHMSFPQDNPPSKPPSQDVAKGAESRPAHSRRSALQTTSVWTLVCYLLVLGVSKFTLPDDLHPAQPTLQHVWYYGWITAISTGLGAVPLLFASELGEQVSARSELSTRPCLLRARNWRVGPTTRCTFVRRRQQLVGDAALRQCRKII
jgi:hypothetical protein